MSGNSKVIGVTMSRPRSSCHSVRCSVRADTRSYCSLVCVQSLCQSHPTSTLFVWNMESRQQPVVFVLSYCHRDRNAGMLHIKHFCDCLNRIMSTDYVSACGRGACEGAKLSALLGPPLGWFILFHWFMLVCRVCSLHAPGPPDYFVSHLTIDCICVQGPPGALTSDHTPAPLANYGAGGKQTATSRDDSPAVLSVL